MKKIVAAHDGSDASDRALSKAVMIAGQFGASLQVVSVVPDLHFTETPWKRESMHSLCRAETEGVIELIREYLADLKADAETAILQGISPADAIIEHAKSCGADLVVVGATGKQASPKGYIGSVSLRLAANAPCSVLIVR